MEQAWGEETPDWVHSEYLLPIFSSSFLQWIVLTHDSLKSNLQKYTCSTSIPDHSFPQREIWASISGLCTFPSVYRIDPTTGRKFFLYGWMWTNTRPWSITTILKMTRRKENKCFTYCNKMPVTVLGLGSWSTRTFWTSVNVGYLVQTALFYFFQLLF